MRHFTRAIVLNCLELKRITIFSLEFVTTMFVEVTHFFDFDLFVILNYLNSYLIKCVFKHKSIWLTVISKLLNLDFDEKRSGLPQRCSS
jgi:hypothetical protein